MNCEEIIPNCNQCTKDLICLECNNKAVNGLNNCTTCENGIDWKFEDGFCKQITICPKYFYKDKNNNSKIICINDIKDCPLNMSYINSTTNECISNENQNNITFEYKNFSDFAIYFLKKNKIKLNTTNKIYSNLQTECSEKPEHRNIKRNLDTFPEIIRTRIELKSKTKTVYKNIDFFFKGIKIMKYNLYLSDDLTSNYGLNSNETQKVIIVSPPYENLSDFIDILNSFKNLTNYLKIMNSSFDIFYGLQPLYYNMCYPKVILKKYDESLRARREYLASKNIHLCEDGCLYEGDNLQYFQVNCYCPLEINLEKEGFFSLIRKGILDIAIKHNFLVTSCYNELFSRIEDIRFFYIYFISYILIIVLLGSFIYKMYKIYKLKNEFKNANEYFKDDNVFNIKFKETRKKIIDNEERKDYEKFKKEKHLINNL